MGFSKSCNFFWRGGDSETKNAEFRCDTTKGDPFVIGRIYDESIEEMYSITIDHSCPLCATLSVEGKNVMNAEFKCNHPIKDTFWIRHATGNKYRIGFKNCALYWERLGGDVKNAEFRCGDDEEGDEIMIEGWKRILGESYAQNTRPLQISLILF